MIVQAEIDKDGVLKVDDPDLFGKTFPLSLPEIQEVGLTRKTDWESIKYIVQCSINLDFPRRNHAEIIQDLHKLRG